jgi:hypothetical protein
VRGSRGQTWFPRCYRPEAGLLFRGAVIGVFRRSIIVTAIITAAAICAPCRALAQSVIPTEKLTVEIAEHALAPGTTKDAAEAWLRYWAVDYLLFPPEKYYRFFGRQQPPSGTKAVLIGDKAYPSGAMSAQIIRVFVFLDAGDAVLGVRAEEGLMVVQ